MDKYLEIFKPNIFFLNKEYSLFPLYEHTIFLSKKSEQVPLISIQRVINNKKNEKNTKIDTTS